MPGCIAVERKSKTDVKCFDEQRLKHQTNPVVFTLCFVNTVSQ